MKIKPVTYSLFSFFQYRWYLLLGKTPFRINYIHESSIWAFHSVIKTLKVHKKNRLSFLSSYFQSDWFDLQGKKRWANSEQIGFSADWAHEIREGVINIFEKYKQY